MDLTGRKFGRLTVLGRCEDDYVAPSSGKRRTKWNCLCECGKTMTTTRYQLTSGRTQSCGCLQKERTAAANTTHGGRYDRLHNVWANMKNRCLNPNYDEYKDYGGRGISVCDEWLAYPAFRDWALSQGYNPSLRRGKQTLDRIDIDGDYCPDNCRFADMYTQANNKQNNVLIEHEGETHTLAEWANLLGFDYNYLYYRVRTKGLPISDIIGLRTA